MRTLLKLAVLCLLALSATAAAAEKGLVVKAVRYSSYAAFTRIVVEVEAMSPYVFSKTADGRGLMLAAYDGPLSMKAPLPSVRDGVVSSLELREEAGKQYVLVRLDRAAGDAKDFVLRGPDRIVLDISRGTPPASSLALPGRPVTIVLDPGHGGKDAGIVTAQGYEKSAVLDVALSVQKILQRDARLHVVLTREKDQTLLPDDRAAAANAAGAVIFVSIHAGAGADPRVFIEDLPEEGGSARSRTMSGDFLGFETGSEQQEMVWGKQQALHARESNALGRRLARQFGGNEQAEPVQAPLAGLSAVDAAAVLVEIGMTQDRSQAAEAIAGGVERYARENR